jgi:hypothetical protein
VRQDGQETHIAAAGSANQSTFFDGVVDAEEEEGMRVVGGCMTRIGKRLR